MITKEKVDKFYRDVNSLGMRFPVAELHKATGYSKGSISDYLNKKIEPSGNFMAAFYKSFGESLQKVPRGGHGESASSESVVMEPEAQYSNISTSLEIIRVLTDTNAKLAAQIINLSDSVLASRPSDQKKVDKRFVAEFEGSSGKPGTRVVKREKPKGISSGTGK